MKPRGMFNLKKDWLALFISTLLSVAAVYYGLGYLAVLPIFLFAVFKVCASAKVPLGQAESVITTIETPTTNVPQNSLINLVDDVVQILQICENNIQNMYNTHQEAKTTLHQALENLNAIRESAEITEHQKGEKAIDQNLADVLRALQFDDINMQNLSFTQEVLNLLRTHLSKIAAEGIESIGVEAKQELANIKSKLNPVSSSNLQEGEVELF